MGGYEMVHFAYMADEDNPNFLNLGLKDLPEIRPQKRKKQAKLVLFDFVDS